MQTHASIFNKATLTGLLIIALPLFFAGCAKEKTETKVTKDAKPSTKTVSKTQKDAQSKTIPAKKTPKKKKNKKREKMTYAELSEKVQKCLAKKHIKEAIPYQEEIVSRYADRQDIAKNKLQLAELYFKIKEYAAAREVFDNFSQFYPSDPKAEYAKHKAIKAVFAENLQMDCDQSETEMTVALCKEYLESQHFNTYRKEVVDIKAQCENKLIDKEIYVFNFYMRKHEFDAARNRLNHLKENYLASNESLKPRLLELEHKLLSKDPSSKQHLVAEKATPGADQAIAANNTPVADAKEKDKNYWL